MQHVPVFSGRYHEPFVGGGAVFLALYESEGEARVRELGTWAVLNDVNAELMNAYSVIKSPVVSDLIWGLQKIKHSEREYYRIREKEETTSLARAIRFCYLNKSCFNGLWRVNSKGKFNVPIGSYKNPTIVEPDVMNTWHEALKGVDLYSEDFMYRLSEVKRGDFVYADPPYLPRSKTADFTSYTVDKFREKDHERLAHSLMGVHKRGAKFLCSQGDSDIIRSLFKAFTIMPVTVKHMVGAKASSRVRVKELLIKNFD
jgi:DNA adenine methylase